MKRIIQTLASILLLTSAHAYAQSTLYIQSEAGDYIGQGQTYLYQAPANSFTVTRSWNQGIDVAVSDWWLNLAARGDVPLAAGPYEQAARASFRGTSAGLDFFGQGRGCNQVQGRFTILDVSYDGNGNVTSLAADFEQLCDASTGRLYGEIRVNSVIPLTSQRPVPTTSPDAFAFLSRPYVRPSSEVISNETTVYGINAAAPISILGGSYSVNGAPFTSAAGSVNNRDHVRVRVLSPAALGKTVSATLTVGGISAPFSATTYQPGAPLSSLYFLSSPGDYVGAGKEALYVGADLRTTASRYGNGVRFQFVGPAGITWYLDMAGAGNAQLSPGVYSGAERFSTATAPALDFGGDGRGCNTTSGEFEVFEAEYAADGTVIKFAADFVQRCEQTGPPLYGEVRFNSTVAIAALLEPSDIPATSLPRLANLSTRMKVGSGDGVAIAGFVIGGSATKTVAVRAIGPSLAAYGIANPLADPKLTLVRSSDQSIIAINDGWQGDAHAADLSAHNLAPSNGLEAALFVTLQPGAYTAIVTGSDGTDGVAVVEVYEVDSPEVPVINLSTRGQVLDGENVMIGGFVVSGAYPQTVLVRALGPSLAAYGVSGTLANPSVALVRMSDQAIVATNDDWGSTAHAAQITADGFAPSDPRESAILVTLEPGAYTAIVRGADGTTGVGIVEVYAR